MKSLKYLLGLLVCLTLFAATSLAQDSTKAQRQTAQAADVKKWIDNKTFVFHAQYANPLGGGTTTLNGRLININPNIGGGGSGHIYLNYNYDVTVKPDSVIAYLPYFGRTTFAPSYNPTDNGVKFTSTKFGYETKAGKKGKTTITITPRDAGYNQKLVFTITPDGNTTLQMNITNRNAISYDGYITGK